MRAALNQAWARSWLALLMLAVWQVLALSGALNPLFFPPPSKLIEALPDLLAGGHLARNLGWTLARTGVGFGLGVVCGIVVSVLICRWERLRVAAWPVIAAANATPRLTLLPMAMLIFGVNEFARISLVALCTLLLVVIQLSDAVRGVNADYVNLAMNYGASRATVIRRVYVPACLPQGFTALRLGFGRALVLTISVELLSCDNGLGNMIWSAWQTFATERLYLSVMAAAALGLGSQILFERLELVVVPWRNAKP
jgi:ABC-type nitrate/sulfonate/bicarbonate transport system permease component